VRCPVSTVDPEADLLSYAFEEFQELGFGVLEALALVAAGVSPSALRELVRHGADRRTAAAILI